MKISKEDVLRISNLSSLELNSQELETYSTQLESIIKYFQELNELDTSGIEPLFHAIETTNVLREDIGIITTGETKDLLLKNAPQIQGSSYKVPKIIA